MGGAAAIGPGFLQSQVPSFWLLGPAMGVSGRADGLELQPGEVLEPQPKRARRKADQYLAPRQISPWGFVIRMPTAAAVLF